MSSMMVDAVPSAAAQVDVDPRILAIIGDPAAPRAGLPTPVHPPATLPGEVGLLASVRVLLGITRHGARFYERMCRKHGDIFRLQLGREPITFVADIDEIQKILRNESAIWSTAMGWDSFMFRRLSPNIGNPGTLVSLDFEPHRAARRVMQPAFTAKAIKGYVEIAQPLIENAVSAWLAQGTVAFKREARALLSDVANAIFTGVSSPEERKHIDRALREIWAASLVLVQNSWLSPTLRRARRQWKDMHAYFSRLLPARRANPGADMFSQLAQLRDTGWSDEILVNGFLAIMLAAYDTTAAAVTSTAYLLAKHPDWQRRVRDEAQAVAELDWAALQKLEQLDWVWKETLRLMPVAGFMPRRALRDVDLMGHRIPAGCMVGAFVGPTGLSARNWQNPDLFDPERFSPARAEDRQRPGLYQPFGAGAHACVGLQLAGIEAKLLFHELLTRGRFELAKDYDAKHIYTPMGMASGAVQLKVSAL